MQTGGCYGAFPSGSIVPAWMRHWLVPVPVSRGKDCSGWTVAMDVLVELKLRPWLRPRPTLLETFSLFCPFWYGILR